MLILHYKFKFKSITRHTTITELTNANEKVSKETQLTEMCYSIIIEP